MRNSWDLFPEVVRVVQEKKQGEGARHHPFEHAIMVAQYALLIAEDERTGELGALAGILHNTDRFFHENETEKTINGYLRVAWPPTYTNVSGDEVKMVIDAVLNHSKKNDPSDSPVLVCLKDADRLANISPFDIIARSARHYADLPLFDPKWIETMDPTSTYRNHKTVFRDAIHSTQEWETWFRLPKAQELAKSYFDG